MNINKHEVILTDTAKEELQEIYDYISKNLLDLFAANKLMDKIEQKLLMLEQSPYACKKVHIKQHDEVYRKLVIDNYIALYQVNDKSKQAIVYRILYGKVDYLKIMED